MRNIDKLAKEKFNGDINKTVEFLVFNSNGDEFYVSCIEEMNKEEAFYAQKVINDSIRKKYPTKDSYRKFVKKNFMLSHLDLTEEEVKNAKVNPYKAKLLKSLLSMLIMEGGVIAISLAANQFGFDPNSLGIFNSLAIGLGSMTVANNLLSYTRFKKLKNLVEEEKNNLENNSVGRGL